MRFLKRIFVMTAAVALLAAAGCGKREPDCSVEVTEETVYIEGLENDYTLLFVTDAHIVVRSDASAADGGQGNESLTQYENQRYSMFQNAEGTDSMTQFEAFIRYANEQKVDGVLFGGDIIDCPSEANVGWLAEQLDRLKMPFLYVLGNHDWTFPWDYMTEEGRKSYLPMLEPLMQGGTAVNSLDFGEFIVVGIDNSCDQVNGEALPEFERICDEGRPVIVMAHVPFLTQSVLGNAREVWSGSVVIGGGNYGGIYPDEYSDRFVKKLTAADSPVELMLAGHVHFYDKDVIEGEKDVLQIVGGAGYEGNAVLLHVTGRK